MHRRILSAGVMLLGVCGTPPLWAQPTAPNNNAANKSNASSTATDAAYGRHMDNGLKLYSEGHYDAASAEFEAAYRVRPNASPLINMALCYKKQGRYGKAIKVLERAQRDHRDSMTPQHRAAVDREIKDIRALLAYLTVTVVPADVAAARLLVDGQTVDDDWHDKPLALAPGSHIVRAEAEGYKAAQAVVRLVSGNDNEALHLELVASLGTLEVHPSYQDAEVSIDGEVVGKGDFRGRRNAGVHQVTVTRAGQSVAITVLVTAGGVALVEQAEGGALRSDAEQRAAIIPGPPQPNADDYNHYFVSAHFGLFTAVAKPDGFTIGKDRTGFGVGGSVGYLVFPWGGIELMGQYSDIRINGEYHDTINHDMDGPQEGNYRLQTFRGAAMLRFNLPAASQSKVRFAGGIGGGFVLDRVGGDFTGWQGPSGETYRGTDGFRPFPYGQLDLGIEVEINQIMAALVLQQSLHSTKHLAPKLRANPFGERPQLVVGPFLRVGYAF